MPGNGGSETGVKDGAKSGSVHTPPKVPLLGIANIPRGEDYSVTSGSPGGSKGCGSKTLKKSDRKERRTSDDEESTQSSAPVPFNEGTLQSITPRTLSLLTPRSAAAYNAAAFSSFKGGSSSSFSPYYGTAAMQHCFKSYGKLKHYAAKAQDVDDLIKRTELSVDRLRFSSVSFSNAWKLGKMASAVYFTDPDTSLEVDSSTREATFRDTVLVWKFHAEEEHPESVRCQPMDIHQCADESFCVDCTYLFAVFVATFYAPKKNRQKNSSQRSTSADAIELAHPHVRAESEGEEEEHFVQDLLECMSETSEPKSSPHHRHHHRVHSQGEGNSDASTSEGVEADVEQSPKDGKRVSGRSNHSAMGSSSSSSTAFSEPTIIKLDWEDSEDQDDADADKEIVDTLSSPQSRPTPPKMQTVRPAVPPPEENSGHFGSGDEEATLCAERFFDTTMTPRGVSSAFATLPRVKDDDVMHVNSAMLHHLGGTSSTLLGRHKEIGIGQVCINIHIWNGDKSSSFTRAAAFSKAIRLDRAWALPSAARAASLLVFSDASVDSGAITTPRGEHIVSRSIDDSQSSLGTGLKEYSLSALIRSKLLRTYRTLAASFSPGFLQMLAGKAPKVPQFQESTNNGSESERRLLKVRLDSGAMSPTPSFERSGDDEPRQFRHHHHHRRNRFGDSFGPEGSECRPGNRSESDSDNDDPQHPSVFKVPYNVVRNGRDRTGSACGDERKGRVGVTVHVDHRQTVSDDEYSEDGDTKVKQRREDMVSPTTVKRPSHSASPKSTTGGLPFIPPSSTVVITRITDKSGSASSRSISPGAPKSPEEKALKSQPLKTSGKSISTTALTSKRPAVPMLALGSVSDARRCNSQAQLIVKPSGKSDSPSPKKMPKSASAFSVPKLSLSSFPNPTEPTEKDIIHPRSHSSDPSQEVRGRSRCGCECECDEEALHNAYESEPDRNGGEVSGGMRRYRSVLSKINEQLYLTGESGAQDLTALREAGVQQVLNVADAVCHEYHPGQFKYLSIDLQDNGAKEDLRPLFLETIDFIEKGRTVLHCQQGVSRSATFVIAYIMWKNQLTFRQALDYVMKRRPVISPNGGFMGQLLLWEVVLHNSREALKSAPPRLLRMMAHVGSRHEVLMVAKDVANVSRASLDPRTCFLLHNAATRTVYMWIGSNCAPPLLAGGANVCEMMKKYLWVETVVEERQDFESDAFWRTLRDNRGTVTNVAEFSRDYACRPPGFIYRFSAFDPVELRYSNLNVLREQTKRQAWVYFPDEQSDLLVSVPKDFIMRINGREITNPNEIATIISRLFCLAAHIPETTPFKYIEDGNEILHAWLGTNPAQVSSIKMVPAPRKDV